MAKKMLIDATHAEETRVVVISGNRLEEYDFETSTKKQIKGNIYLAKVTRVEPSLQACFVEFGGNRHGFLAFSEIHPDYWQIPIADREALLAEERRLAERDDDGDGEDEPAPSRRRRSRDDAAPAAHPATLQPIPFPERSPDADSSDTSRAAEDAAQGSEPESKSNEPAEPSSPIKSEAAPSEAPNVDAPAFETGAAAVALSVAQDRRVASDPGDAPTQNGDPLPADTAREPEPDTEMPPPINLESVGGDEAAEEEEEEQETRRRRFKPMRHYKIQEVIKRRQVLLVQVVKEERGTKGAALTTYISLAGRYCVLMPNTTRGGGISRRITSPQDRKRLKEVMHDLDVPDGMAVILRTAGMERARPEIRRDYDYLLRLWDEIRELTLNSRAPALVYEEGSLIKRAIRDLYSRDIDEILVDGGDGFEAARAFLRMLMPDNADRIRLYDDPQLPLFQRHQVEAQLDEMHENTVRLRSGGYIVLNQTEALVAIDVNSGRATRERHIEETALKTNLEAADEVARQLRLRDLAGLIVIDFIDMEDNRHIAQVERRLKEAMRSDRARIQIGRISPFGLLELSRQRMRPSLAEVSTQTCPHCGGSGFIRSTESTALRVLRGIEEEGIKSRSAALKISVPANVAIYILNQKRAALTLIEQRYALELHFESDDSLIQPNFRLERLRQRERGEIGPAPVRAGFEHGPEDVTSEPSGIGGEDFVPERAPRGPERSERALRESNRPQREPERAPRDSERAQRDSERVTRESEPISGPPREAEAGETEGFAGDEAGRGRGRRRRRRRGRGRGRDEAAMPFGEAAQADLEQRGMTGGAESDAAIATSQSSPPSQTPSDAGAQDRDSAEQAPSAASPDAVPADLEAGPRAAPDGSDDDTGRRRRRGRRGGRGRRGDDQANGAATRAPLPTNPPTETQAPAAASGEDDLLARARALYAPADRFAPPPAASVVAEGHEWPWNRREEQPAPPPMAMPAPEPVAEAEPATGPITTETPAPTADIVVPGAPTAATDRAVQEVPAAMASPTPPTPEPPAVGPLEAPASAATEPAPAAEPAAPAGPPRRGWWRRSPT